MKPAAATSLLALSLVTSGTATAVAEEKRSLSLARDPRVVDAVVAWKEWVEYQAAINEVPGMSVGVVHDQEDTFTEASRRSSAGRMDSLRCRSSSAS